MIIHEVPQGSNEWHRARAGSCTASMFKVARQMCMSSGENKGKPGAKTQTYAMKLAIERISGEPLQDDQFETYAMRRGHELEPDARAAHERLGIIVERAGFIVTDDGKFGASVDGLMEGRRKGAEYKCLVSPEGLADILLRDDLSAFTDQIQGGMWVAGLEEFHFGLYCPALKIIEQDFTLRVVPRNDNYIDKMVADLLQFDGLVLSYIDAIKRGAVRNKAVLDAIAAA